jgi:hypothetical protein
LDSQIPVLMEKILSTKRDPQEKSTWPLKENAAVLQWLVLPRKRSNTRAVWKVRGLAAVRRCYADGDGDRYAKL